MTYDAADNARKCYDLAIETMREKLNSFRKEVIGDCTLYLGDCRDVLPLLPRVDACVTDPPYGISYSPAAGGRGWSKKSFVGTDLVIGDDAPFDPAPLLKFGTVIMWGANHYADKLPARDSWLIWDKRCPGLVNDFADCEMAWLSVGGPARVFRHLWYGAFRASEKHTQRVHPTQKPIEVMRWCLEQIPEASTILDPYMGSGTTGVACVRLGKRFIGIEIDQGHFETACKRIRDAYAQPDLFIKSEKPKPAEQLNLLGEAAE
jgi:site-specific DNA-methyltransferase (adenine-specific)